MNALKNILKPGHDKEDDAMYGSGTGAGSNTANTSSTTSGYPTSASDSLPHNQTASSGSNIGGTGSTTGTHTGATSAEESTLYETKQPKEHGILRQILNPNGDKYDEAAYGANATTNPRATTAATNNAPDMFDRRYEDGNQGLSSSGTSSGLPTGTQHTGTGLSSSNQSGVPGQQSHLGRDAALAGGAGTAAYEAEKHHHGHHGSSQPSATGTSTSTTSGYPTSASDAGMRSSNTGSGYHSGPTGSAISQPGQTGTDHHYGRDAAAAGGLGAAGVGAYEADKHHNRHDNSATGTSSLGRDTTSHNTSGRDHHLGRDAGAAGAVGAGAYEAEKHHHNRHDPSTTSGTNFSHPTGSSNDYSSTSGSHHNPLSNTVAGGAPLGAAGRDAERHLDSHGNRIPEGQLPGDLGPNDPRRSSSGGYTGTNTGSTSNTGDRSHLGRDAAVGAGAAGLAGEAAHHHYGHHNADRGVTSGLPDRSRDNYGSSAGGPLSSGTSSNNYGSSTGGPLSSNTSERSHLGRDAALGAGAAGLAGEGIHHHNQNRDAYGSSTTGGPLSSGTSSNNYGSSTGGPLSSGTSSNNYGSSTGGPLSSHTGDRSHLGRDAALGAGAAGLAGEGHHHNTHGSSTGALSGSDGPHFTRGPHITDTANRLDPHVPGEFPREGGLGSSGTGLTGGSSATAGSSHHLGRDAALGAGAAGLGAEEASRHHHHGSNNPLSSNSGVSSTQTGSHNPLSSNSGVSSTQSGTHGHLGRDAGIATGTAGLGAEEASRHHHGAGSHNPIGSSYNDQRAELHTHHGTTGTSTTGGLTGSSDPRYNSTSSQQPGHHYGRDAAGVAGVGAAGAGAYELANHGRAGSKETDPASSTIGPHSSNVANVVDPRVQPDPAKQKDVTPAHNNSTLNKLDPRVDSQNAPTQATYGNQNLGSSSHQTSDPQNQHHYGRDAAVVGGGAAAAGAAGHEFSKKDAEKQEKEHLKEMRKAEKAEEKQDKKLEKEHEKQEKKLEKEHEKAAHHHDKEEKKSGGLLGFLHHKKDKDVDDTKTSSHDKHKHEAEAAAAGTAGVAGTGAAYEHSRGTHGANQTTGTGSNIPYDNPSSTSYANQPSQLGQNTSSTLGQTGTGSTAQDTSSGLPRRMHEDYQYEGASQPDYIATHPERLQQGGAGVGSGSSGLTPAGGAAEQMENSSSAHHHNKLHKDPPESVRRELEERARQEGHVTDSRTGLPMNVGQYGSGAGGTDGSSNIHGYQNSQSRQF